MRKVDAGFDAMFDINRQDEQERRNRIQVFGEDKKGRVVPDEPAKQKVRKNASVKHERPKKFIFSLDDETNNQLDSIKFHDKIDKQELVYVAVCEFLKKYSNNGSLNKEGLELLK